MADANDHALSLRQDGTCSFRSYREYDSDSHYSASEGRWRLEVFFPIRGGDVEIPPGWLIVVEGNGNKYRLIPMNSVVRGALLEAMQDRSPAGLVFDANHNGVNEYSLKSG